MSLNICYNIMSEEIDMQTKECIERYKIEFEEEIRSLFWSGDGRLKKKIYGKVKEDALREIVSDVFVYDDDLVKSLNLSASKISVFLETKYKAVDFRSFIAPLSRVLLPVGVSLATFFLTTKSLKYFDVEKIFGVTLKTFFAFAMSAMAVAMIFSVYYTKANEKKLYAIYIRDRLNFEIERLLIKDKKEV